MITPMKPGRWKVEGTDKTPDGYRDHVLYAGDSKWQAWKAWRAARRENMELIVATRITRRAVHTFTRVSL